MATDPVCGMQVDERTAAGSACSRETIIISAPPLAAEIRGPPSAHVAASPPAGDTAHPGPAHHDAQTPRESPGQDGGAAGAAGAALPGTRYTCPMHPEIVREAPGDCPICGMALCDGGHGRRRGRRFRVARADVALWVGAALSLPLVVLAMSP